VPGAGSMTLLFATAGPSMFLLVAGGYFHSLNAAHGTVTWPILPRLLLTQLGLGLQFAAAHWGAPLWVQNLIFFATGVAAAAMSWIMLRAAHPWLGKIRPVVIDTAIWRTLAGTSVWVYFYSLGSVIYTTTDRLLINAGFGAEWVPTYLLNAKLCELSNQVLFTASSVCLPKINQWLASPDPTARVKAVSEIQRLNTFQIILGCGAAMVYVAVNDHFIGFWLGKDYIAPMLWQLAFAFNLAVTASGDAGTQISGVSGQGGLRFAGITIGLAALLNLGLSFTSMKLGSIAGIAMATVLAQSIQCMVLGWRVCWFLKLDFRIWLWKSWGLPVLSVTAAFLLRQAFPLTGPLNIAIITLSYGILISVLAACAGFKFELIRHEWRMLLDLLGKR